MMEIIHINPEKDQLKTSLYEDFHQWTTYQWDLVNHSIEHSYDVQTSQESVVRDQQPAVRNIPPGTRFTQEVDSFPQFQGRTTPLYQRDSIYDLPPKRIVQNGPCEPSTVSIFQKGWRKDRNYTGKPYDILYDKAKVFISFCRRLHITEDQYHAVFPDILEDRAEEFYLHHIGPTRRWDEMYDMLDKHFNTNINHSLYWADWTTMSFARVRRENPDKTPMEVLETLLDKIPLVQRALGSGFQGEVMLRTQVTQACRGVPELETALSNLKADHTCEEFFSNLRASLQVALDRKTPSHDIHFVDRRYTSNYKGRFKQPYDRDDERKRAKDQYLQACTILHQEPYDDFASYLVDIEGENPIEDSYDEDQDINSGDEEASTFLMSSAFFHRTTGEDIFSAPKTSEASQFLLHDPYSAVYQGELWDTGAAKFSTVGKPQVLAYLREYPRTKISWVPGSAHVRFGANTSIASIGIMNMENPLGSVTYHILDAPTPFLFSLYDADRLGAYFNNVDNVIVRKNGPPIPVIRKWGHPFFNLSRTEASMFFTEGQLRRLHRRFGHPRTDRLHQLLKNAGHNDVDSAILEKIKRFCHHCQSHDPAPRRFKFSLKDESHFNYEIVVDVVRLGEKNVLHVIDTETGFQGATFLKSLSARDTWNALCKCWISTYVGPPDHIVHDPGTNFASAEFRNHAEIMGISCDEMPVEAHWAVGKVERAHAPLRRTYDILHHEIGHNTDEETILQMAVKALNDTAGPHGIVPTLLVFGTYPRINKDSPPSPDIVRRAEAIQKAMKMLQGIRAEVEINRAINTRNGPNIQKVLSLPIQSEVLVWRENKGWTGPYEIQGIDGYTVTVKMVNGPTQFRATHVKPYFREEPSQAEVDPDVVRPTLQQQPRKRGRPRKGQRPAVRRSPRVYVVYLSQKEKDHYDLAVKLRLDNVITAPGAPYEESDGIEIDSLINQGVFIFILYEPDKHDNIRIYSTRMVREIKNMSAKPYEKSRLVIQGYGDWEKEELLTQAPTIQRMSQRLLLALGPTLVRHYGCHGEIRDITQAYTQAVDQLTRTIIARLPKELESRYPKGTLLQVIKPLYGLAESGLYWYKTYSEHHKVDLGMKESTYDPCLLYTTEGPDTFGITAMQTDDTLSFATMPFSEKEEAELLKKGLRAKPKTILQQGQGIDFNGGRIQLYDNSITFTQKGQVKQLQLIDADAHDAQQQYVSQRARGAYLASICQPEASYDLSVAAQVKQPEAKDIEALNVRLKWQIDNPDRGLTFIPLDLSRTKMYIFTDGSFANNADLSSQLGFVIVLAEETARTTTDFQIQGNIVHWSSTKCKRVTRSVLASELYGMTTGFDSGISLSTTLNQILRTLQAPRIPVVVCSDSRSLYECLVRLGTTDEKRLMIDIMSLRESYEKKEISEVRWIDGKDNPADALTKKTPNSALQQLITSNTLRIRIEAYVDRLEKRDSHDGQKKQDQE
ncbi:hypothetical protein QIS74_03252 [Colletotrichum tabaci]|uniref:Integrase catalytic domain-containing protein n=1 Tax=Colletotrichum tabaci TaxID=1209068 RepID=A0AAV9TN71_9PEZI